jgi:hypothetical protein
MPCIPALVVLVMYVIARMYLGKWTQPIVPAAAFLVLLSGPGNIMAQMACTMPVGLMAILGSFVLFGFGTIAALTRSRWHKAPAPAKTDKLSPPVAL